MYTHTTWGELQTALSRRLEDLGMVFWTPAELRLYLSEALRTYGALSAFWRERGAFNAMPDAAYYDLATALPDLLGYTTTDQDLIALLQHHLLEFQAPGPMFTLDQLADAVRQRRSQFLSDTGIVQQRRLVDFPAPPASRVALDDHVIDVRRAVWLGLEAEPVYTHLWREDERAMSLADARWPIDPATPEVFSVMTPPPLTVQVAPPPVAGGRLQLTTVESGADLNPGVGPTVLGIPDDLVWIVKWGALADLLGQDGLARDPERATFCEERYRQGVALTRLLSVVLHAELESVAVITGTVYELDAAMPGWENLSGAPTDIVLASANLLALFPVPDALATTTITLDVVRRAPVPTSDVEHVQVGREQLDAILDYAEHLALFKVGGAEWTATGRQATNFLVQAIAFNQRLGAAARYIVAPKEASQKEADERPRRNEVEGAGALSSTVAGANRPRGSRA